MSPSPSFPARIGLSSLLRAGERAEDGTYRTAPGPRPWQRRTDVVLGLDLRVVHGWSVPSHRYGYDGAPDPRRGSKLG
ncbi:hypothetical protein [Streptomyces chartreusis]|uniref:hypothetical protein n=1 Tax=Streptomyces chartreusis TaxID=1969 RepID=UPI0038140ED9